MIRRSFTIAVFPLLVACATRAGVETQHLPDGTLRIKCDTSLAACLSRAEDLCHGTTYEVVRARDQRDRYGPEMGTAQIEVRSSEAFVRCGSHGKPIGGYDELKLPPRPPEGAAAGTATAPELGGPGMGMGKTAGRASAPPAAPPSRACIPGATQACVGPGKCEGGQSCLPDGSAFGPCDCGTLGPPVTAPSAAGTATPAPAPTTPGPPGAPPPTPPAPSYKGQTPPAQPMKATPAPKH